MINEKVLNKLKETQPLYFEMLLAIAVEELQWLKSNSKMELSAITQKNFQRLHEGLLKHSIIDSSTSTLVENLEVMIKIS